MSDESASVDVITRTVKEAVLRAGFSRVGACAAAAPHGIDDFYQWLDDGYAGQMTYMEERRDAYRHPDSVLSGVRSVVMMTLDYHTESSKPATVGHGRVSRYAWGDVDYHDLIHRRLKSVRQELMESYPDAKFRAVVDTAPLMERDFARQAGLGWQAKNTLLLSPDGGSWFFLAALLTDLELSYDAPFATQHCGTCTACLDACPTQAFPKPGVLDATRCISYLTIELRDEVPLELRSQIGDWAFGCDVCQEVCPWQSKSRPAQETAFAPRAPQNPMELTSLFELSDEDFRDRFRKTPLWRTKRTGLLRNAAIVLGNQQATDAIPALLKGLQEQSIVVREACLWALRQWTR